MTKRVWIALLAVCLAGGSASAQDPMKVAPGAYKVQFENAWVRVVRVHYGPHEKIPVHDHPTGGTVFVYLEDGGPVRFTHAGEESYALERPATVARAYRVARPVNEVHEAENLSDVPSDFLRIEMKTEPVDVQASRGRFPAPQTGSVSAEKVELDSGWLRTTRITCAAGQKYEITSTASPSLLVAFAPVEVRVGKKTHKLALGDTLWMEPGASASLTNKGKGAMETLRVELKSKPSSTWTPGVTKHEQH